MSCGCTLMGMNGSCLASSRLTNSLFPKGRDMH